MGMPRILPLPQALQMPLRDAFRGLSTVGGLAEDALEPFASALPERAREALGGALRAIEGMGAKLIDPQVSHEDVGLAASVLKGEARATKDIGRCAVVLAFAWNATPADGDFHPVLSETLTTARLSMLKTDHADAPGEHAAAVLHLLRDARVAGELPGFPSKLSDDERSAIDLRLFAIAIWLLSERAATMEAEVRLLDMALALTRAYEADILASMNDREVLARTLRSLSGHL